MDTRSIRHSRDVPNRLDPSRVRQDEESGRTKEGDQSTAAGKSDFKIELSPEAKRLAEARETASEIAKATSPVREDRVADLKARIKSGEYQVDPGKIADGMLREAIRDEIAKRPPE
jgi:negative regulator of flagellin synthesis FlgM